MRAKVRRNNPEKIDGYFGLVQINELSQASFLCRGLEGGKESKPRPIVAPRVASRQGRLKGAHWPQAKGARRNASGRALWSTRQ